LPMPSRWVCPRAWSPRALLCRLEDSGSDCNLFMAYRTELEARLAKKTTTAIVDFQMIENGDRVMVGLSGGKDCWALLQLLDILRQRAPIGFSLVAVNVDSGYTEYKHDLIAS